MAKGLTQIPNPTVSLYHVYTQLHLRLSALVCVKGVMSIPGSLCRELSYIHGGKTFYYPSAEITTLPTQTQSTPTSAVEFIQQQQPMTTH